MHGNGQKMKYTSLLNEYRAGVEKVKSKLAGLAPEAISFRPKRKDGWSIKDHIIHMVDSDTNGFIRIKSIIAQPCSECFVMDEDRWTENIRRKNEDINSYVELFGIIRRIVYDLLKDEPEESWTRDYFIRDYKGEKKQFTIEKTIELYVNHVRMHLEYIEKNIEEFNTAIRNGLK
jgi:hypothetical protein